MASGENGWFNIYTGRYKNLTNEEAMSIGLIENIQREQLSVIEEAQALDRLVREFELTHQEIADVIGRSRAGVSNLIRLWI